MKKQRLWIYILLLFTLISCSCSLGRIFGPTSTPTSTATPTQTSTPTRTSTPTDTSTPVFTATPTATATSTPVPVDAIMQANGFTLQAGQTCSDGACKIYYDTAMYMIATYYNSGLFILQRFIVTDTINEEQGPISISLIKALFPADVANAVLAGHSVPFNGEIDGYQYKLLVMNSSVMNSEDFVIEIIPPAAGTGGGVTTGTVVPETGPTAAGGVYLYQDDFSSNAHGWDTNKESDSSGDLTEEVANGKYHITMDTKTGFDYQIAPIPDFSGKDYLFSIDATILDTNAAPGDLMIGFTLREGSGINGERYEFDFYNNSTYVVEVWPSSDPQSMKQLLTGSLGTAKLEKGVTNTFAIRAVGSTFTFYINGNQLNTLTDTTINESGGISLWLMVEEPNESMDIDFDNLTIQAVP